MRAMLQPETLISPTEACCSVCNASWTTVCCRSEIWTGKASERCHTEIWKKI